MGNTLLLDSNTSSICKGVTKERRLLENKRNKNSVLTLSCALGSLVWHAYTFHRGYYPLSWLQHLYGIFSVVFLLFS